MRQPVVWKGSPENAQHFHEYFVTYIDGLFRIVTDMPVVLQHIEKKGSPFFVCKTKADDNAGLLVSLYALKGHTEPELLERIKRDGVEIAVDNSLYPDLQSKGRRIDTETGFAILIETTQSVCMFDTRESSVFILNHQEEYLIRDTLRLLKSFITLHCERRKHVMLHASGVVFPNKEGTLFLGDSRNGKTTILLETLTRFGANMLSCDTSILRMTSGELVARGWPSNFSVSLGTVHDYPDLYPFFPQDKKTLSYSEVWEIFDKEVLDAVDVVNRLGVEIIPEAQVRTLICLNFDPTSHTRIYRLTRREEIENWIKKVYLGSLDELYPNWHQFWVVGKEDIDQNIGFMVNFIEESGIEVYQMDWAPGPESLLKRVPSLEPHNLNTKLLKGSGRIS